MKKTLLLILYLTLSFSNSGFYISYDLKYNVAASDGGLTFDSDLDSGAFSVGYEFEKNNFGYGVLYDLIGAEDGSESWEFLNFYGKYFFSDGKHTKAWGLLGFNFPIGDLGDYGYDADLSYGVGFQINNKIGFGFTKNHLGVSSESDVTINRIYTSYSF